MVCFREDDFVLKMFSVLRMFSFFMKENVLKMEEKVLIHELWKITILFLNCSHFYGKNDFVLRMFSFSKNISIHRQFIGVWFLEMKVSLIKRNNQ